jgi:sulfur carrier protein
LRSYIHPIHSFLFRSSAFWCKITASRLAGQSHNDGIRIPKTGYGKYHSRGITRPAGNSELCSRKTNNIDEQYKINRMAKIKVNDEEQEVQLPLTLSQLIKDNKVFQPEMVTIQVNEEFVEKEDYDKTQLKDGDQVDFLYFMGGGAC